MRNPLSYTTLSDSFALQTAFFHERQISPASMPFGASVLKSTIDVKKDCLSPVAAFADEPSTNESDFRRDVGNQGA